MSAQGRCAAPCALARILHDRGNGDAHDCKARINSRRTTATVREEVFALLIGLAEDRMAMIESIEKLRELENVFRQISGFRSGDALFDTEEVLDAPARAPRFRWQTPRPAEIRQICRGQIAAALENDSGSNPALRKMLVARTTAYCA